MPNDATTPLGKELAPAALSRRRRLLAGAINTISFLVACAAALQFGRGFGSVLWPFVSASADHLSYAAWSLGISTVGLLVALLGWATAEWVAGRRP